MRLQDDLDFTTLTWVKGELDETLKQARHALEAYVEDPSDASQMRFCATYLHQVHGTLRMVELYGAAMVTEEMERLATALLEQEVADRDEAYTVLMRGIVQLPDYLERLQSGHKDIPIVLLPLLNDLRSARGERGLSESVLFTPDLSRPLPAAAHGPAQALPEAELKRAAELLRTQFQVSLLRWFRGEDIDGNLARIAQVCDKLVAITAQEEARQLFWVAAGVIDALRAKAFEPNQELKQTIGKVEREVKRLADSGEASFRVDPPRELTRALLYFVANVATDHGRMRELREVFRLDALLPSEEEIAHARGSIAGHNRALLDTVSSAIKEDLLRVKDALDLFLRGGESSPEQLAPQVEVLDRVSDTLGMIGLGVARRVVQEQRNAVFEVAGGQRQADEATLLDIAGALLYVEASLDDQVQQLGSAASGEEEQTTRSLPKAESQKVLEAVIREAHGNFQQAKQCFVAFVESNWDHAQLADVPRLLDEVGGALRIMEITDAPQLLHAVRRFTEDELLRRHRVPNGQQMDTLADALASLEYYLEAVRDHRSGRGKILEVAERSLESLGYWPVPDALPDPKVDEVVAEAPAAPVQQEQVRAPAPAASEAPKAQDPEPAQTAEAWSTGEASSFGDMPTFDAGIPEQTEDPTLSEISPVQMSPGDDLGDLILGEAASEPVQRQPVPQDLGGFRPVETERTAPPTPPPAIPAGTGGFEGTSDEIDEEIREVFVEEVQEEIANLDELLPAWKANLDAVENLKPIRRVFHTLKGSGRLVGAMTLGEFSWKVENMLNRVLDKTLKPGAAVLALLDHAHAQLPTLLAALRGDGGVDLEAIENIKAVADRLIDGEEAWYVPASAATPQALEVETSPVVDELETEAAPEQGSVPVEAEPGEVAQEFISEAPPPLIDPVLFEILKAEVSGHLESVDGYVRACAGGPIPVTDTLLRSVHTMNGAFAMTEVPVISEVVSPLEGYIKRLMAQRARPSGAGLALVAEAADAIRAVMLQLEAVRPVMPDLDALAQAITAERDALPEPTGSSIPLYQVDETELEVTTDFAVPETLSTVVETAPATESMEVAELGEVTSQDIELNEAAIADEFPLFAETIDGAPPSESELQQDADGIELQSAELTQALEGDSLFFEELDMVDLPAELEQIAGTVEPTSTDELLEAFDNVKSEAETDIFDTTVSEVSSDVAAPEDAFVLDLSESDLQLETGDVETTQASQASEALSEPLEAISLEEISEAEASFVDVTDATPLQAADDEFERELLELPPQAVLDEAAVLEAVDEFDFEIVALEDEDAAAPTLSDSDEVLDLESKFTTLDESISGDVVESIADSEAAEQDLRETISDVTDTGGRDTLEDSAEADEGAAELVPEIGNDQLPAFDGLTDESVEAEALAAAMAGLEADSATAELSDARSDAIEMEVVDVEAIEAELIEAETAEDEAIEAEAVEPEAVEAEAEAEAEASEVEVGEAETAEAEAGESEASYADAGATETIESEAIEAEASEAEDAEVGALEGEAVDSELVEEAGVESVEAEAVETEYVETETSEAEVAGSAAEFDASTSQDAVAGAYSAEEEAELAALFAEEEASRASSEQPAEVVAEDEPAEASPAAELAEFEPSAAIGQFDFSKEDPDPEGTLDIADLDDELLDIFLEEGGDILDHSDGMMAQLRDSPGDRELVVGLQRDLHTLKGGARMAGLAPIGDLGHAMESLLEMVAEGRRELSREGVEVLERSFDRLHSMVTRVSKRHAIAMPVSMIGRIEALARGETVVLPTAVDTDALETSVQDAMVEAPAEISEAPSERSALATQLTGMDRMAEDDDVADVGVRAPQEQIRIRADLLDRLVNYAGEVAIYRARLEQQLGSFRAALVEMDQTTTRLREQLRRLEIETEAQIIARYQREADVSDESFDPLELDRFSTLQQLSRALSESAADLVNLQHTLDDLTRQYETLLLQQSRVSSDLQEGLMRTRMVQFESLVPRLRRIIRQTAGELGKKAQLRVEGAQGEMDRSVLDRMTAPLEHMLRNALAHGLEQPEDRLKAGKSEEGHVRIAISREASEVVIRVSDDGRGMDRDAIRRKAIQRGLLKPDAELSDRDMFGFVLETGFSTAESVSKIAGRGVGMDVVNNEIKQLGGQLFIDSERGKGSTFTVRLPFTLAVTQAVLVNMNETLYAVPIASVQGVARIARETLEKQLQTEHPSFEYAGEDYAIYDLGLLLGQSHARADESLQIPLLLARSGDLRAAICVDSVVGSREIVVKPTGPQVSSVPGIFGATIMGDGGVVVILDVTPLVRRSAALKLSGDAPARVQEVVEARRVPLVMVVDDSITMRKVTSRVLERQNYEVLTAKDGVDAIEKLQERVPDVMLLDIEMPRMDGYELATHMRNDARLKGIPIIMITSRTGDKHRQRAFEIGVDRYLGKPYQENELMRNVQEILQVGRGGGG